MVGNKVLLTYKRKRPSVTDLPQRCGSHDLLSEPPNDTPLTTPHKHVKLSDNHATASQKTDAVTSSCSVVCGTRVNLLQCDDCHRPHHLQCLDPSLKEKHVGRRLCSDCIKKELSASQPFQKSSPIKEKQETDDSGARKISACSLEPILIQDHGEGTSGKDSGGPSDYPRDNQIGSCSYVKDDSRSKDKSSVLHADSLLQAKSATPLRTFIRRFRRKKDTEVEDAKGKLGILEKKSFFSKVCSSACTNTCSCEVTSSKDCSQDHATELKQSGEDSEKRAVICQNQDEIKDADPAISCAAVLPEAKGEDGPKNNSGNACQVVAQSSEMCMDTQDNPANCLGASLNDAAKDSSSDVITTNKESESTKLQAGSGEKPSVMLDDDVKAAVTFKYTKEGTRPYIDLSVTPPDSSGSLDCNIDLEQDPLKNPVHAESETLPGSLGSTSSSHVLASHEVSPPEMLEDLNKRVEESPLINQRQAIGAACSFVLGRPIREDSVNASPLFKDTASKSNYLQLFSEEKTNDVSRLPNARPEANICLGSEERWALHSGNGSNQPNQAFSRSPFFHGSSHPTEPKYGRYVIDDSPATLQMLNCSREAREFFHDAMPRHVTNQRPSAARHKLMLDSITSRARMLNGRGSFQEKLKPCTTFWSEDELDYLWIGVRRHGRDNWDDMLRDPHLRFSSWRVAMDLAERWDIEQFKLFNGTHVSHFHHSRPQGISMGHKDYYLHPETGMDETQLSLGDNRLSKKQRAYYSNIPNIGSEHFQRPFISRRPHFPNCQGEAYDRDTFNYLESEGMLGCHSFMSDSPLNSFRPKGNLPHWLREAVFSPPMPATDFPFVSSVAHPGTLPPRSGPWNGIHARSGGVWAYDQQPSTSAHCFNPAVSQKQVAAEPGTASSIPVTVSKCNDPIIINSDASSEETISDDHGATRP